MEEPVDVLPIDLLRHFATKKVYAVGDAFFADGDRHLCLQSKQTTFDDDLPEFVHKRVAEFSCHIAGCTDRFTALSDYEAHYGARHRHVCAQCKKSFPSAHLLDLHIEESHDSLFQILVDKQSMYCCLVEGCPGKFDDPKKRRNHLTKVHKYPHDFRFNSLPKPNASNKTDVSMDVQEMDVVDRPGEIIVAVESSSTQLPIKYKPKIPRIICFGMETRRTFSANSTLRSQASTSNPQAAGQVVKKKRNKKKGGRDWHDKVDMDTSVNIEEVAFDDMLVTLPSIDERT